MRKLTLLTGALLVLALAVAGGVATPRAAWALCYCDPYEPYAQAWGWGKGTDCTAAHNDLINQTSAAARADCGTIYTCFGNLVITGACHSIGGGMYQEDGYREYKCKVCGPISP